MSQEHSGERPDGPAVVEWGDQTRDGGGAPRQGNWRQLPGALWRDPGLVPLIAGLGAIAIFASLVGEWQVTRLDQEEPVSATIRQVSVGVAGMYGWSAAYLTGVFAATPCLALVLFGPRTAREHIRVAGLALCGALLAVLVALTLDLREKSAAFGGVGLPLQYDVSYGPGLVLAFAGVAGYALALHLAGRHPADRDDAARAVTARATGPGPGPGPLGGDRADWPWRRPRVPREREPESALPPPTDLTVQPAQPFVHPPRWPEPR